MKLHNTVSAALFAAVATASAAENQFWTKLGAEGKIFDNVTWKVEEENKFDEDHYIAEETLFMVDFKITDWLSIGIGDRVAQERKENTMFTGSGDSYKRVNDHYWQNENRPTIDVVFSHKINGWRFDDRVRFEWRDKDDGKTDYMRYRNRIRVRTPYKWTSLAISPYASWEFFIEDKPGLDSGDMFNRSRLQIGFSGKIGETLNPGVYYMVQHDKDGSWTPTSVWGFELTAKF